jgi:hypothetical protein
VRSEVAKREEDINRLKEEIENDRVVQNKLNTMIQRYDKPQQLPQTSSMLPVTSTTQHGTSGNVASSLGQTRNGDSSSSVASTSTRPRSTSRPGPNHHRTVDGVINMGYESPTARPASSTIHVTGHRNRDNDNDKDAMSYLSSKSGNSRSTISTATGITHLRDRDTSPSSYLSRRK